MEGRRKNKQDKVFVGPRAEYTKIQEQEKPRAWQSLWEGLMW